MRRLLPTSASVWRSWEKPMLSNRNNKSKQCRYNIIKWLHWQNVFSFVDAASNYSHAVCDEYIHARAGTELYRRHLLKAKIAMYFRKWHANSLVIVRCRLVAWQSEAGHLAHLSFIADDFHIKHIKPSGLLTIYRQINGVESFASK